MRAKIEPVGNFMASLPFVQWRLFKNLYSRALLLTLEAMTKSSSNSKSKTILYDRRRDDCIILDISLRYKVPNQCPQCDFPGHSVTICCRVGGDVFDDDDDEKTYQRGRRFGQNHSPVQTAFVQKLATRSIWNIEFFFIKMISDCINQKWRASFWTLMQKS